MDNVQCSHSSCGQCDSCGQCVAANTIVVGGVVGQPHIRFQCLCGQAQRSLSVRRQRSLSFSLRAQTHTQYFNGRAGTHRGLSLCAGTHRGLSLYLSLRARLRFQCPCGDTHRSFILCAGTHTMVSLSLSVRATIIRFQCLCKHAEKMHTECLPNPTSPQCHVSHVQIETCTRNYAIAFALAGAARFLSLP